MSDDLAANAATWVPPWQRPASGGGPDGEADSSVAEADSSVGEAGSSVGEADSPVAEADSPVAEADSPVAEAAETGNVDAGAPSDPGERLEVAPSEMATAEAATTGASDVAATDVAAAETDDVAEGADAGVPLDAAVPSDAAAMDVAADVATAGREADADLPSDVMAAETDNAGEIDSAGETDNAAAGAVAAGAVAADGLPRQWAGLAGAKWQDAPAAEEAEPEAATGRAPDAAVESNVDAPAGAGKTKRAKPESKRAKAVLGGAEPGELAAAAELFAVPGQRVPDAEDVPTRTLDDSEVMSALEAILMVVDEPVGEITLANVLEVPAEQVANALIDMSAAYTRDGRGFDLRRAAGGWRFYTRSDYSAYVEKFVLDGQQMRLTQASLETLAVVAYKQPVSRSRVSAIRGVNCDGVIRTLITRGMIEECGIDPDSGAHLYKTTTLFLEKLGLDSVEQLPPLAPFLPDNLDEVASGA